MHPELTKFDIANKHTTSTLRKMKLKRLSSGQSKQRKWRGGEEKRKKDIYEISNEINKDKN